MIRKACIWMIINGLMGSVSFGQTLSPLQVNKLTSEVNRLLQGFEKYSAYQPEQLDKREAPAEFLSLFDSDASIQNFLDPGTLNREGITPGEYYDYIRTGFGHGLSFKLLWNTSKLNRSVAADELVDAYVVYVPVGIRAIGMFREQVISNISEEYYVVIAFSISHELVSNASIHRIQAEKPVMNYTRKSEFLLGVYAAPAFTRIHSRDIFADGDWDAWGEISYRAGLNLFYKLSENICLYSGLGLSSYRSAYEIKGFNNFSENTILNVDMDGDSYYEHVDASVTEENTLTWLDVPLGIRYSTGSKKLKFFLQGGVEFSFMLSSNYSATGNSEHQGYYPDYHVVLYDLPDYGFTTEAIDINEDWDLNSFNLSFHVIMGAEISLGKNSRLQIGPFANTGLTDLGYDRAKHRDDYYSLSGNPGKLTTRSAGILFEWLFKL